MMKNNISDDFFKKAILKGNEDLLNDFSPAVREFKVGCDNFFEISKDSEHKRINDRITKFVLAKSPINSSACGFVQGKSYYDFLRPHIQGYYFLRLDIKNFFHSISALEVKSLLAQHFNNEKGGNKYSALDIAYMAVTHKVSDTYLDKDFRGKEVLPIGFSSSPVISNIIFRKVDILIQKLCEDKGIIYSRYADDMFFSSGNSKYLHSEQFEKDISIFVSTLSLKLKKSKRKATENTISLNGYVVQNRKRKKDFFHVYKEKPVGNIRLSDKKLKPLKKISALLKKQKSPIYIMENVFHLNPRKFALRYGNKFYFYSKYADDQLQNKLKGYRSYLVSLIKYNDKYRCVNIDCIKKIKELVEVFESNIK
ncbi:reverse transcriptase [Pantoea sp. ICBG 828]|uniref:reverse transcriptase domain-containing protein n=1 Tax=unclassified Pantoea TaxID=2630326 RepID=UPI000CE35F3E|nr:MULTISPECIES: reverse transcriptase domain-containing protein [unclassified Pantoea]NIG34858.1 RNA-directed DNA polymerase [Pantoea sp. Ap-959]PPC67427.1 reverse transcriptase [Pantoea sp. ICBG 828]